MKTLLTFCLLFCLPVLSYGQTASPIYDSMQGVSGAEKITNLAEVEADLGRFTNLSATTGILSTANAQTLNVTGNATVNGFNYTASPTLNGASSTESTSTSVVGGIRNGDFSEGEGNNISSNGMLAPGVYFYRQTADGSASISNGVAKIVKSSNVGYGQFLIGKDYTGSGVAAEVVTVPVEPAKTYRFSYRYKAENVSNVSGYGIRHQINRLNSNGAYISTVSTTMPYVNGSTDWNFWSETFYTDTAKNIIIQLYLLYESGIAYFDDIKLEQVTTHTNNSTTPTVAYPVITGVSSEFVDQQQTNQDETLAFGDVSGAEYWRRQTFTPTKRKLSAITLQKYIANGTPVGNVILEIRNPSNAIIASVDVEKAVWDAVPSLTNYSVPIFALLEENIAGYQILLRSDADESSNSYYRIYAMSTGGYSGGSMGYSINSGSSWTDTSHDIYFKTHYAENTRQITLTNSSTGTSTTVDWGNDGLPDGAVVDLYNGTMSWQSTRPTTYSSLNKLFNSLISADNQLSAYPLLYNRMFNGWSYSNNAKCIYGYGTSYGTKNLIFSFPATYIKNATFDVVHNSGGGAGLACDYSFDNSSWTSAFSKPSTYGGANQHTTFFIDCNSNNNIFLRINGAGDVPILYSVEFTATLDTSKLAPLILASGSNAINQSVNGGSYKANVDIKSVSGGFQTTLNEANKQLTVLRNAPRSYLETPDKTQNAVVIDNDGMASMIGPVQVNGATIMNASATPAYDIVLPYNSGGAIGSSWNTYSETKYKNIISDVTEASYANIASRLAGVQSKMVTRKIPDAVKAKFFDAEIEWVTDVVSVTEELKTQVVEPVYEVVKMGSKVTLDSKATEEQLLTAEADRKIVSYVTKEVSVLRSPGEYPRQEFRGWKIRQGVDEATKKQLENLYFKPHPEPIADTAPEAYRVPEGFAWSKWVEESTIYQNWILPQIINELPKLRKRLEALEASK